ncbi:MAG: hypothetical protein AMXMBFR77_08530 [Phycisphaerales bacterium]|nr:hypothetical protein [Phycisphaerales bacterium]MDL1903368.1 hypothetical protein [Synechococcales cyanobacterium CNB]GIK18067.1 MAG: hypothetical protein BroJett004_02310 [Planctomycetota bacterium]
MCVTVRLGGTVLAREVSLVEGEDGIARAAAAAMSAVEERLAVVRDATWRERMTAFAPTLEVTLELAGPLVPLTQEELARPSSMLSPGVHGVAVRVGDSWRATFPAEMLASGAPFEVELSSLVARAVGDPQLGARTPTDLARSEGVVFYRFRTVHLAHPARGEPPVFLYRGARLVDRASLGTGDLRALADRYADHLMARRWRDAGRYGMVGTLLPVAGRAEPPFASPLQQGLVAFALAEYAAGAKPDRSERARSFAMSLLEDLAVVEPGETDPLRDSASVAMLWVAVHRLGARAHADDDVRGFLDALDAAMAELERAPLGSPPSARDAVVIWARAVRAAAGHGDAGAAERDLRAVYGAIGTASMVSLLPWLGWAELALHPAGEVPAAQAMWDVRDLVWEHQLSDRDATADALDLVGGVVFTRSENPLPTWHTVRVLPLMATMLADERLTERELVLPELSRLLASLRFVRQLTADEAVCHLYADRERAAFGVRSAPWDQRMPPEATALALLTLTEVFQAMDARAEKTP